MRKLCVKWKGKCQIYNKMLRIRRVKIKGDEKVKNKMTLRYKVVGRWRGKREEEFWKINNKNNG